VEKIFDSYLTYYDETLLYVLTTHKVKKWIRKSQVSSKLYESFMKSKCTTQDLSSCNTEKTQQSNNNKCKTRGVVLGVYNCGIILSFRELYGSESLTQVCLFYLETLAACVGT